jgi:hypothetical protein
MAIQHLPGTDQFFASARSNSARAPKIPKKSFPDAVIVSIATPSPVSTLKPIPRSVRSWTVLTKVVQSSTETVELPHQQSVPLAESFQAGRQVRTIVLFSRSTVL